MVRLQHKTVVLASYLPAAIYTNPKKGVGGKMRNTPTRHEIKISNTNPCNNALKIKQTKTNTIPYLFD